jgi:hypothetical protein
MTKLDNKRRLRPSDASLRCGPNVMRPMPKSNAVLVETMRSDTASMSPASMCLREALWSMQDEGNHQQSTQSLMTCSL